MHIIGVNVMLIQSCTFSLFYPPRNQVREHLFELEKHFDDFQKPFTLVPLPADVPLEIPRIIAITKFGHSQLTFCGNSMQLNTKFDDIYSNDVEKCVDYIREKCRTIVAALPILNEGGDNNTSFYYSGITMMISFDETDGITNPTEYISRKFLNFKTSTKTDEVQFRIALVENEKYYLNIMLQNNHEFNGFPDERGSLTGLNVSKENLQVILDVNDRYAFDHVKNYFSSETEVKQIADLVEIFSRDHLSDFIKNGELRSD